MADHQRGEKLLRPQNQRAEEDWRGKSPPPPLGGKGGTGQGPGGPEGKLKLPQTLLDGGKDRVVKDHGVPFVVDQADSEGGAEKADAGGKDGKHGEKIGRDCSEPAGQVDTLGCKVPQVKCQDSDCRHRDPGRTGLPAQPPLFRWATPTGKKRPRLRRCRK
nr:hypothetical protein [uncultured bacterium]